MSDANHSPCASICVVDADGRLCIGCYRTLDEIAAWSTMSDSERRAVLNAVDARIEAAFNAADAPDAEPEAAPGAKTRGDAATPGDASA